MIVTPSSLKVRRQFTINNDTLKITPSHIKELSELLKASDGVNSNNYQQRVVL